MVHISLKPNKPTLSKTINKQQDKSIYIILYCAIWRANFKFLDFSKLGFLGGVIPLHPYLSYDLDSHTIVGQQVHIF